MVENLGVARLTDELKKLNPGTAICFCNDSYPEIIIANCDNVKKLALPNGYYISEKNGLTNKHSSRSGMYEFFDLVTTTQYLSEYL